MIESRAAGITSWLHCSAHYCSAALLLFNSLPCQIACGHDGREKVHNIRSLTRNPTQPCNQRIKPRLAYATCAHIIGQWHHESPSRTRGCVSPTKYVPEHHPVMRNMGDTQVHSMCPVGAPTGRGSMKESQVAPTKWPALRGTSLCPNMISCSDRREMVQNGRLKSWWSMCGGMQSICTSMHDHSEYKSTQCPAPRGISLCPNMISCSDRRVAGDRIGG